MGDDLKFHEARAVQKAQAAELSTIPEVASAHRQMAEEHSIRAYRLHAQSRQREDVEIRRS